MHVREISEMMVNGGEQNAEVPAERAEAVTTEPESLIEITKAVASTAEPGAPQGSIPGALAPAPAWQGTFTARSRKSIQEEQWLEKELARRNALKRRAEDTLAGLAREKEQFLKLVTDGESWADRALSDTLGKIEAEQRKLTVFTEEASKAQADLDNFRAGIEAYAGERARIQGNLAELAGARLELDCELERMLREELAILKLREDVVKLMERQAAAIDLSGDFSAGVPASLHEALSLEIVSASKAWNARFRGEEAHLKAYVVSGASFEPEAETLYRKAVYNFGETVFLLEEEAAPLLRNDRPTPGGPEWSCLPPSLMTAEDFAAAKAEAGPLGSLMVYYFSQRHGELEQKRRQAYLLERRGTLTPNQHLGGW